MIYDIKKAQPHCLPLTLLLNGHGEGCEVLTPEQIPA